MLKTKTKTKRADANGGQQNQKSERRPELLADAVMQKKTLRPARVAAIIYPVVEDDLRANGEPVFASCAAMERNLIYAFSKGLISGRKTASRAVWMEFESALSYVTTYVEVAKTSDKRVSMPRKTPAHVEVQVSPTQYEVPDLPPVSPDCSSLSQFVLQKGDLLVDIVKDVDGDALFLNELYAAKAALSGLGYTLRRIEKEVK
jgi:hypothetical protein